MLRLDATVMYNQTMQTLTLTLPDSVQIEKSEVMRFIAAKLYERADLTLGKAAEVAGMPKWEFAEILANYGVSIFNYPASDLARDLKNA